MPTPAALSHQARLYRARAAAIAKVEHQLAAALETLARHDWTPVDESDPSPRHRLSDLRDRVYTAMLDANDLATMCAGIADSRDEEAAQAV